MGSALEMDNNLRFFVNTIERRISMSQENKEQVSQSGRNFYPILVAMLVMALTAVCLPGQGVAAGLMKAITGGDVPTSIKSHRVDVTINNGFSRTEVDQVFLNEGDVDLEAIYSFPLPKQASVSEVSLWIDGTEVVGEVVEKNAPGKSTKSKNRRGMKRR